jgi:hypothetical protein
MNSQQPDERSAHDLLELAKTAEHHMKESSEALTALAERLQRSPQVKQDALQRQG